MKAQQTETWAAPVADGLPRAVLWGVLIVTAAPALLGMLGWDFSSPPWPRLPATFAGAEALLTAVHPAFVHTVLEWTGVTLAAVTALLALFHFRVARGVVVPVIGLALLFAGVLDAFHTLTADQFIPHPGANARFIPFSWVLARFFHAGVLMVGVAALLRDRRRDGSRGTQMLARTAVGFGLLAMAAMVTSLVSPVLPRTLFPGALASRPWDLIPLVMYVVLGAVLVPRLRERAPSVFVDALLLSLLPAVAAQLHMAFGSDQLYDHHFIAGHFLKTVAYATLFVGVGFDYVRTYQGALRSAVEQVGVEIRRGEAEAERARLELIFQQAPAVICVMRGRDHCIETANQYCRQLFGGRELVGRPVREAMPEMAERGLTTLLDRVWNTGEPVAGTEVRTLIDRNNDGRTEDVFFNYVCQPLASANQSVSGILLHAVDVTEQVHARELLEQQTAELQEAQAEQEASNQELQNANDSLALHMRETEQARAAAEQANAAKSEFLATMSHELRTPLNAIGGYTELLEMGVRGPINEKQRKDLQRIQHNQQHLLGLINDILNFAKLEAGRFTFEIAGVLVDALLRQVRDLLEPQLAAKGLAFRYHPGDGGVAVRADRERLEQIVVNLLSNAVKFTNSGGSVELSWEADSDRVHIQVRDTGRGIPADRLDSIFEPFVQVSPALTREAEGTGLGLAISRDLARGMNGDLAVRSTPGQGSVFTLTLPRG